MFGRGLTREQQKNVTIIVNQRIVRRRFIAPMHFDDHVDAILWWLINFSLDSRSSFCGFISITSMWSRVCECEWRSRISKHSSKHFASRSNRWSGAKLMTLCYTTDPHNDADQTLTREWAAQHDALVRLYFAAYSRARSKRKRWFLMRHDSVMRRRRCLAFKMDLFADFESVTDQQLYWEKLLPVSYVTSSEDVLNTYSFNRIRFQIEK